MAVVVIVVVIEVMVVVVVVVIIIRIIVIVIRIVIVIVVVIVVIIVIIVIVVIVIVIVIGIVIVISNGGSNSNSNSNSNSSSSSNSNSNSNGGGSSSSSSWRRRRFSSSKKNKRPFPGLSTAEFDFQQKTPSHTNSVVWAGSVLCFAVWAGGRFFFYLGGGAGLFVCCLGGGACLFVCFGRGAYFVFAVWAGGRVFFFAVWACLCFCCSGGVRVYFLLFGRGTGVHSLTGPGSTLRGPTTKTKQVPDGDSTHTAAHVHAGGSGAIVPHQVLGHVEGDIIFLRQPHCQILMVSCRATAISAGIIDIKLRAVNCTGLRGVTCLTLIQQMQMETVPSGNSLVFPVPSSGVSSVLDGPAFPTPTGMCTSQPKELVLVICPAV